MLNIGQELAILARQMNRSLPEVIGKTVLPAIDAHRNELEVGALMVIDLRRLRVRLLPLQRSGPTTSP
jgi:hypothetical protein